MSINNAQIASGKLNGEKVVFFTCTTNRGVTKRVAQFANGSTVTHTKAKGDAEWTLNESENHFAASLIERVKQAVSK